MNNIITNTNTSTAERTAIAATMSSAGQSVDTIADTLGVSVRTVRKYLAASVVESPAVPAVVESPAVPAAATTGQTHAGIDIAGLRLIEDGPGYWIAYKGQSTDRRMGTIAKVGVSRFVATGRGMACANVDSVQEGGEFIARSYAGKQSDKMRTPAQRIKADLQDSARARNRFRAFKSAAHKSAHVTLAAQIERLEATVGTASERRERLDNRATAAATEIAVRKLEDTRVRQARTVETIAWVEHALTLELDNLRALRDKALGLGLSQSEIEQIVASVKPKGDARDAERAEIALLLA